MRHLSSNAALLEEAPALSELRVEAITDYQSFLALEPAWKALAERAGNDHPFLEFDWARAWWESFGGGKKLYVLVVKDGDQPVGIAPLLLSRQRMYGLKLRHSSSFTTTTPGGVISW